MLQPQQMNAHKFLDYRFSATIGYQHGWLISISQHSLRDLL